MVSALDVAWFFVVKGNGDPSITQLKLQKLVYYAQAFHLAFFDTLLFSEKLEAWDYGPVVVELREQHRNRGAETILPTEKPFGKSIEDEETRIFLQNIWLNFGHFRAGQLIDMTHAETPWKEAYSMKLSEISTESIKEHFKPRTHEIKNDFVSAELIDGRKKAVKVENLADFLIENKGNLVKEKSARFGPLRTSALG